MSAAAKPPRGGWLDPEALMRIKHLELRANAVVEGFMRGLHRSPFHGFSTEFTEYRQYIAGDDLRHLDWRVYARSDRYYVQKFEEETNLRCHLLVDNSRSMQFGSRGWTKADYARTLAATYAHFLQRQGDAVGLMLFADAVEDYLPALNRRGHLRQLMLRLERAAGGAGTSFDAPLERMAQLVRQRGMIVLISDLLAPLDALERRLGRLAAGEHEISVFQVLDPAELAFDFEDAALFRDLESGREFFIDPAAARAEYLARLNAHLDPVTAICHKLGVRLHKLSTARPLELALFDYLRDRSRRRRSVRRRTGAR